MDLFSLITINRFLSPTRKKFIFSILLVVIIAGCVLPKPASADTWVSRTVSAFLCSIGGVPVVIYDQVVAQKYSCDRIVQDEILPSLGDDAVAPIMRGVAELYVSIGRTFADYSYQMFDWVAGIFVKNDDGIWSITNDRGDNKDAKLAPIFIAGWNVSKQWANIIIVIALIAVALAFMLNFTALDKYKQLLIPILITALLINFSGVLVGLMIDIANVAMLTFLGKGNVGSFGKTTIFANITSLWGQYVTNNTATFQANLNGAILFFTSAVVFTGIYIIIGITVLIMSILFIIRYVMLALLFIVSPLAFALRILPDEKARAVWGAWWSMFLRWATAGVVAAFFTNFGLQMATVLFSEGVPVSANARNLPGILVPMIAKSAVVIFFLLVGMYMAVKSSTAVVSVFSAGAALAKGAVSLTGRAGSGTFKSLFPETHGKIVDIKNKTRDRLSGIYDRVAEVTTGQTGLAQQRQIERNKARIDKGFEESLKHENNVGKLKGLYDSGSMTQKAQVANRLSEMGQLHVLGNQQSAALGHMTNHGYDIAKTIEKNPLFAANDPKAFTQEKSGLALKYNANSEEFKRMKEEFKKDPIKAKLTDKQIIDELIKKDLPEFNELKAKGASDDQIISQVAKQNLITRAYKKANLNDVAESAITSDLLMEQNDKKIWKSLEGMSESRKEKVFDLDRVKREGAELGEKEKQAETEGNKVLADYYKSKRDKLFEFHNRIALLKDRYNREKEGVEGGNWVVNPANTPPPTPSGPRLGGPTADTYKVL